MRRTGGRVVLLAMAGLIAVIGTLPGAAAWAANCAQTSVGKIPIDDLGAGLYLGSQGGLYPGGTRTRPAAHDAALDRAGRVRLLDADGNPDAANGRIVLVSVGMSNTSQEFGVFMPLAAADPQKNARVVIVNGAQGGQPASTIADPTALYWVNLDQRLLAAGVTPLQVQSVWLKQANAGPTQGWTAATDILRGHLHAIVQIIRTRYPNTRSIYLSSRIYAGYATSSLNPEPYAYESGFAVKWLVEEQILGSPDLNFDPARGQVFAPWLSWGPYLWADGLTARADGLTWECADLRENDGTHPSAAGQAKVAGLLLDFFKNDATTRPWFTDCDLADPGVFAAPPEVLGVAARPAPGGAVEVGWDSLDPVAGLATRYDVIGGRVTDLVADRGFARAGCLAAGAADTPWVDPPSTPPAGEAIYYLVRGRNACGAGTWGDGSTLPDARDALDSGSIACP